MAYKPVMTGGVIVEVDKKEYEALIGAREKIAAVERLIATNGYASVNDIIAILDIEREGKNDVLHD